MEQDTLVAAAHRLSTATAHEASGRIGALPASIKPIARSMRLCGRAFPLLCKPGDNLFLHHALYVAMPGDVLVADTAGATEFGYWGEVMTIAAQQRGLAGVVITGGVRDSLRLIEIGFPVFAIGTCIRGTGKDPRGPGQLGSPVLIGGVEIRHGDLVLGDNDGVMVVPAAQAEAIVAEAHRRDDDEQDIFAKLRAGGTTLDIYALPPIGDSDHASR